MTPDQVNALKAGDILYRGIRSHVYVFTIAKVTDKMVYREFACEANGHRRVIFKSDVAAHYYVNRTEAAERQIKSLDAEAEYLRGQADAHEADSLLLYEKLKEGEL